MLKTKLLSLALSTSALLVAAPTLAAFAPIYAQTTDQTGQNSSQPTVNKVKYSIDYVRVGSGSIGDVQEGLQKGGPGRRGRYSAHVYAGTQSSHYFIPHRVKSANLHLTGTTLDGTPFTYDTSITVNQPVSKKKAPPVRRRVTRKPKVLTAPVTPTPSY